MEEKKLYFKVEKENSTVSEALKELLSRRFYRHLKYIEAKIYVNDCLTPLYGPVHLGDELKIVYLEEEKVSSWPMATEVPQIVYENEHYLIVNKEPDLLTIPIAACPNSLYQKLVYYLGHTDIHILNRLDKKTSGLIVVAKDRYAASLLEPTHQHITRKYVCLVEGIVEQDGTIQNYIVKCEDSNKRKIASKGQLAISHYRVLKHFENQTLLEFILETGRTHQIRLHTSSMGHPIIGDSLYGHPTEKDFLYLTSYEVSFYDPFQNQNLDIKLKEGWWNE